jgi:hypothetical protein
LIEEGDAQKGGSPIVERTLEFIESINHQDLSVLENLMTEDHVFIDGAGDVHPGRSLMFEGWRGYFEAYPNYLIHVCEIFLCEPCVVVVGRTTGSHVGLPRAVEILDTLIWEAEIEAERVKRWQIFDDSPSVRERLGADADARVTKPPVCG